MLATELLPSWHELVPSIFSDARFRQTSRSRYQANIDGVRAGVVVAWRNVDYDNHALNQADFDRLLELRRNGMFAVALVVAARRSKQSGHTYIAHREAENLCEALQSVSPRNGPFGPFWLLRDDLSPLDFASADADDVVPF